MKVAHIVLTDLSGAPMRIASALRNHTDWESKLIVFDAKAYARRAYPQDLKWEGDREEGLAWIESSDIIHFHEYIDPECNDFEVNFHQLAPKARALHQFQMEPSYPRSLPRFVVDDPKLPQLAIPHFPERYYPYARVVPNIIPLEDPCFKRVETESNASLSIVFTPTSIFSAWEYPASCPRWATKGYRETEAILKHFAQKMAAYGVTVSPEVLFNQPIGDCYKARQRADIGLEELVTGSFHQVMLECMAASLPTLAYLDERSLYNLRELTGSDDMPWINCRLEEAETMLTHLTHDADLRRALGDHARSWMEEYYNERVLVQHYVRAYEDILERPHLFKQKRFDLEDRKTYWHLHEKHTLTYKARQRNAGHGRFADFRESPVLTQMNLLSQHTMKTWLQNNYAWRMDPTVDLFGLLRRQALVARYAFAAENVSAKEVLDLGSGTGWGAASLKAQGGATSVVGVEKDFLAHTCAEQCCACEGLEYLQEDIETLNFPEARFDCIVALGILEYIRADGAFLRKCYEWLKPGGVFILSSPDTWRPDITEHYVRHHSRRTFENFVHSVFSRTELFIHEPPYESDIKELKYTPCDIRPCIEEDILDPGQVLLARCTKP